MPASDLSSRLASAARSLQRETGSQHTLDRVVSLALDLVDGCQHAGISLNTAGRIDSPATSSDVVLRVDTLQYEFNQGPCLDAIRHQEIVYSGDLAHDARWPQWGPRTAQETGIRSMMCFRLFTDRDLVGALNLYSDQPQAFLDEDREIGTALAAHSAMAVVASQKIENLQVALDSRTEIGHAVGIIMERFNLGSDQAFSVLSRLSQDLNRKLRAVAHEVVTTRRLPVAPTTADD